MTEPDPLSEVLSRWQPKPDSAPDFATQVHAQIAAAPTKTPWARILHFPATLPLAAGFAIVLGIASAVTLNRTEARSQMADAYARSIDPVWMTSSEHGHHP